MAYFNFTAVILEFLGQFAFQMHFMMHFKKTVMLLCNKGNKLIFKIAQKICYLKGVLHPRPTLIFLKNYKHW